MREERILGNNIQLLLNERNLKHSDMASSLGYDENDVNRICEGRVFLAMNEIEDIAEYLHVNSEELLKRKDDEAYEKAGCIHYNHPFKSEKELDKIMDLFDLVCDVEEVL